MSSQDSPGLTETSFSARSSYLHLLAWRSPRSAFAQAVIICSYFFFGESYSNFNFSLKNHTVNTERTDDPNQPTYVATTQDSQSWVPQARLSVLLAEYVEQHSILQACGAKSRVEPAGFGSDEIPQTVPAMLLGQPNHWTCWCNNKDLVMIFFWTMPGCFRDLEPCKFLQGRMERQPAQTCPWGGVWGLSLSKERLELGRPTKKVSVQCCTFFGWWFAVVSFKIHRKKLKQWTFGAFKSS